jgi:hypothetical protein
MSEGTPIGRVDDPDAIETGRRTSADADHDAAHGSTTVDRPDDETDETDEDDLVSSSDADREAGYGQTSREDQVDLDAEASEDITERLIEDR